MEREPFLSIGIVGLGKMGTSHAKRILAKEVSRLKLVALCDEDAQRLECEDFKGVMKFTEPSAMMGSGEIDAILIATPHYSHTEIGIKALRAGLHVLVEKPISVHKADCERLIAAHTNGEQVFAAMFNQRTDPRYSKLKQLIDAGELGRINRIIWIPTDWFRPQIYYTSGKWRATWKGEGGGVLLNQCPHQLDLLQWLFGMPERVRAFCKMGRFHDIEVEDDVTAFLEFASGATGVFVATTGEAPGTNRLEVAAERGKVVLDGGDFSFIRNEVPVSEWSSSTEEMFARPPVWNVSIPVLGPGEQHLGIIRNFTDACLKGEPLIAPAKEGIHSVELANAMLYSSEVADTVELPLCGKSYQAFLEQKIAESALQ